MPHSEHGGGGGDSCGPGELKGAPLGQLFTGSQEDWL